MKECLCGHTTVAHVARSGICSVAGCGCKEYCEKRECKTEGSKDDAGKLPYDLVPFAALAAMTRVLAFGAGKYGGDNWRSVSDARRRYFAAAFRHMLAWWRSRGKARDPDTGESHLAHAACCIFFLLEVEEEQG